MSERLVTAAGLALLLAAVLPSAGGAAGSKPTEPPLQPVQSPQEEAILHYNRGLEEKEKAWNLEEEAAAADSESQRQKLLAKAQKAYQRAIAEQRSATAGNPRLYQAFSELGYALRKTGDYEASLEAYNRALELEPDYGQAIEYRAEAYLGLNRLEEAKQAYIALFNQDRDLADELLAAMRRWVEAKRSEPGELSPEAVAEFADWLEQREEIAGQTAVLTQPAPVERW